MRTTKKIEIRNEINSIAKQKNPSLIRLRRDILSRNSISYEQFNDEVRS